VHIVPGWPGPPRKEFSTLPSAFASGAASLAWCCPSPSPYADDGAGLLGVRVFVIER